MLLTAPSLGIRPGVEFAVIQPSNCMSVSARTMVDISRSPSIERREGEGLSFASP